MIDHTVRAEQPGDAPAIAALIAETFRRPETPDEPPPEVALVSDLRASDAWIPGLSLVADVDGSLVGHVVCTRATIDDTAVLALGPLGVHPSVQGQGIGTSLMNAVIVAAGVHGEAVICLLGSPDYYGRFGFAPATSLGIDPPEAQWGAYFQALVAPGTIVPIGEFVYAEPFRRHV